MEDDDLPDMWEHADLGGGWTDQDEEALEAFEVRRRQRWAEEQED